MHLCTYLIWRGNVSNAQLSIKKIIIRARTRRISILDVVVVTADDKEISAYDNKIPVRIEDWRDVLIW